MIIKKFIVGMLYTNSYIVGCDKTKEALIIDPGFDRENEAENIMKEVNQHGLRVRYIVNTHGHSDHVSGNKNIKDATCALILIHEYDAPMLTGAVDDLSGMLGVCARSPPADQVLRDGDVIQVGHVKLRVLHTPGHSRGSICLLGDDVVFTGDTLFAGSIGRTDLPSASSKEIMRSLKKLAKLPDHVKVYPGHGPVSTMGEEKRNNPFMQMQS